MRSPEIALNSSQYLENGVKVTAFKKNETKEPDVIPGSTAKHEADHIIAGIDDVENATIIPGPGYLGMTRLSRFNAVAAAAAHAHGHGGTGHDMALVRASGISEAAATSAARSILSGKEKERKAIASKLQQKGTFSGTEIREIVSKVQKPPEPEEATIYIKTPDGKEEKIETKTNGKTVMVPGEWVTFSSLS